MKIILLNYRYFISGGPERYMFNIKEVLESHGHEVIPFSVKHNRNQPTPYHDYFMEPVGTGNEVYGHEYKRDFKTVSTVIGRILYSFEGKTKMKKLIADVKPDLIYILHFQNKMSCSVIEGAKEMNIPVIQRISDFGHICQNSNSSFYNFKLEDICEKCLSGSILNNIKYKCADNSLVNSVIKTASLGIMNALDTKNKIDAFIFPSTFTLSKYVEFGVKQHKAHYVPTFFNANLSEGSTITYKPYALYIGRLVPEKGLLTLIKAFAETGFNLKIIGIASDESYYKQLTGYLEGKKHNIEFLGEMKFDKIKDYLSECLFTIVPSEWYENLPNTVLESYAFRKCVVGTDIGSLKEIIADEETGLRFIYKDYLSLRHKITTLFNNPQLAQEYGDNAFKKIETIYSSQYHYSALIDIFNKIVNKASVSI